MECNEYVDAVDDVDAGFVVLRHCCCTWMKAISLRLDGESVAREDSSAFTLFKLPPGDEDSLASAEVEDAASSIGAANAAAAGIVSVFVDVAGFK